MPDSPAQLAPRATPSVDISLPRPRAARHGHRRAPERVLTDCVGIGVLLFCLLILVLAGQ